MVPGHWQHSGNETAAIFAKNELAKPFFVRHACHWNLQKVVESILQCIAGNA